MWSPPSDEQGWLQAVNGYYRLTRGTFAQFGVPLPAGDRTIDTVIEHAADERWFAEGKQNACNVLDVAHPMWHLRRQTMYRGEESKAWARDQLESALGRWRDGEGMAFAAGGSGPDSEASLQGTEMWLSIIWLLADLLGEADALGYRPRGVHRPGPVEPVAYPFRPVSRGDGSP